LIRPMPRPPLAIPDYSQRISALIAAPLQRSIRPIARPDRFEPAVQTPKTGFFGKLLGPKNAVARNSDTAASNQYYSGSVCRDNAIQGTAIPTIRGAEPGCGIENPVRITSVDGVSLSMPATLDCDTARALRIWVTKKVKPAFRRDKVVALEVAAHYACRGRNNQKDARISEHGRGKAIDIASFNLASGATVTVLDDYKSRRGKAIRVAHKGACGIFGTTLGPGSDGYHENHIHLDTARYRGGPYCK
jgi:hypothetical protein